MGSPKVGVLIDNLTIAGVPKIAINEVASLAEQGVDADLLALDTNPDIDFYDGVEVVSLVGSLPRVFQTASFPVFDFFKPADLLASHLSIPYDETLRDELRAYDVIVAHNSIAGIAANRIWKRFEIPYILYIHDPFVYISEKVYSSGLMKALSGFVERTLVENAAEVVIQSSFHESRLEDAYGVNPRIIYPGHDSDIVRAEKRDRILLLTRWSRDRIDFNWVREILEKNPCVSITMAGSWMNEGEMAKFATRLRSEGLSDRVEITGYVSEAKLEELYAESKFYLHPAIEGFGMGALEACNYGTIPIMRSESGVCDLLREYGLDELTVNEKRAMPGRVKEIREADPEEKRKKVREIAKAYSWSAHANRLKDIIGVAT